MIQVIVNEGEPLEKALRRFKKKFEKAGVLKDLRKNEAYTKPSVARRMRTSKAARRQQRISLME